MPRTAGAGSPATSQGWWAGVSQSENMIFQNHMDTIGICLFLVGFFFFFPCCFIYFALPLNEFEGLLLPEMVELLRDGSAPASTARPSVSCSFFILLCAHLCLASLRVSDLPSGRVLNVIT